jgi:hypothetical protein
MGTGRSGQLHADRSCPRDTSFVNATVSMRAATWGGGLTLNATGRECLWSDLSAVGLGGIAAAGTGRRVPIGALPHKAPSQF